MISRNVKRKLETHRFTKQIHFKVKNVNVEDIAHETVHEVTLTFGFSTMFNLDLLESFRFSTFVA